MPDLDQPPLQTGTRTASLTGILDDVEALAQRSEKVHVDEIVQTLGRTSSAALIFMPALIAFSPLSGIPGLSTICGLTITIIAAQAIVGRSRLWLPGFIIRRSIDAKRLYTALEKVRKPIAFLDRHTHERLTFLTTGAGEKLLFALCLLGGMIMPFLEVIPFSASIAGASISLLSIAILTLDGAIVAMAAGLLGIIIGTLSLAF